ncbi:uncharacterized protein LOC121617611 isoform X2 [Chelmon rostratus]|uniref:uncharacterized protein LOC121617611 isoform X2 n=1 Tax=Chelmon rostratus TaxID=109905 RepID=UPI001BE9780C|nr:uncharacterized protein LOC121617611 isoform X2 [Chelmon rostratus]
MVAMLVPVLLLLLMMMRMMKSEIITAHSGEAVLLNADLQEVGVRHRPDVRWTHPHLVMSLKSNVTTCHHGRCELLKNGSLRFGRVAVADSGNYSLQVFDEDGTRLKTRDFLLIVEAESSSSSVVLSVLMGVIPLLLFFIIIFIIMRRRNQRMRKTTGQLQENVYVVMHSNPGNKSKDEEEEREEECHYVPCDPVVSMEAPITQQMSVAGEDIYV